MKTLYRLIYAIRIIRINAALRRTARRNRRNPGPRIELVARRYSLTTGRAELRPVPFTAPPN